MAELIVISETRDHDCQVRTKKRLTELKKLKIYEVEKIIENYGIIKWNVNPGENVTKEHLISGIILHEKMSLGNKQTQLIINIDNQNKSYFIETANKFILVTKKNIDNREIYNIRNNLRSKNSYSEIFYTQKDGKGQFGWKGFMKADSLSLVKDIKICRKAIIFIESYHFYLKVKCLLHVFNVNGIDDIIRNICFVYFERTLSNVSDIRCRLE